MLSGILNCIDLKIKHLIFLLMYLIYWQFYC